MRSTNLTELDYLEIENTPTDKVERRDIQSRGVPIYDDNTRESNMVYSSTLSVLRSSRDAILKHAQLHFDRALQYGVLSYNNDKKTDIRQFRKISKSNNIILPSFAMTLIDYKPYYSPSYNTRRYERWVFDGKSNMASFVCIPMKYEAEFRYYCTSYDLLLRFRDNLNFNSQISFPEDGFVYSVPGVDGEEVFVSGHIYFKVNDGNMNMSKLTVSDVESGEFWTLTVKLDIWANLISKPYLTPMVQTPHITTNMNGKPFSKLTVHPKSN